LKQKFRSLPCLLILVTSLSLFAQTSSLVYLDSDGTLQYESFANVGESNAVNIVPDFSHAGYKGGGVPIPDVPVALIIEPSSGDMRSTIQNAINTVAALPIDKNGFRGTLLFKAGQYLVSGPLYIRKSGIVLRGEDQDMADLGGTELVATAAYQHTFIEFDGNAQEKSVSMGDEQDTKLYPELNEWVTFDVRDGVEHEMSANRIISFHLVSTLGKIAYFASKEYPNADYAPALEITYTDGGMEHTRVLPPTDDTYINGEDNAGTVFGGDGDLRTKHEPDNPRVHREVFLKFDLNEIPQTAEISAARLSLYTVNKNTMDGQPNQLSIYHMSNDAWSEETLTWNLYFDTLLNSDYKRQAITSPYVASGRASFDVEDASLYAVGDTIKIIRTPNDHWINTLEMAQYGWTAVSYEIDYERIIVAIDGNRLTVNVPLVQSISAEFGGGEVRKVSIHGRLENCGLENIVLTSAYDENNREDEAHGWDAIVFSDTDNCWVRNVTSRFFGFSCVQLKWAYHTTIRTAPCWIRSPSPLAVVNIRLSLAVVLLICFNAVLPGAAAMILFCNPV
jgi:hypothetical protein